MSDLRMFVMFIILLLITSLRLMHDLSFLLLKHLRSQIFHSMSIIYWSLKYFNQQYARFIKRYAHLIQYYFFYRNWFIDGVSWDFTCILALHWVLLMFNEYCDVFLYLVCCIYVMAVFYNFDLFGGIWEWSISVPFQLICTSFNCIGDFCYLTHLAILKYNKAVFFFIIILYHWDPLMSG